MCCVDGCTRYMSTRMLRSEDAAALVAALEVIFIFECGCKQLVTDSAAIYYTQGIN
jgi:hypothetical protein